MATTQTINSHPMHKRIWQLAIPIMLSNISVPLLGLVDTAILGHLDDSRYLAAVAMGSSLFTFVFWSFSFLRMGTTALVAQSHDQQNNLLAIMHNACLMALVVGLSIILVSHWLIPFMLWLVDGVPSVTPLAHDYLQIRFYFAPVTLLNYALLGYFIGQGRNHILLLLLFSANIINGCLNYYFVYFLDMNSNGIAWATNIAESVQCLLAVSLLKLNLLKGIDISALKFHFKAFFHLNLQLFLRTFFLLFTFAFFMAQGAQIGAVTLSANAIIINLLLFMSNALDGFALASESLVGKAYARCSSKEIKVITQVSGFWSLVTAIIFTIILIVFHPFIISLLTSQEPVLSLLVELKWWLIFLPLAGFASYWLDGIFVGLADARSMRDSILISLFALFLPIQYLVPGITGLWLAMYAFLIGRAIWLLLKLPSKLKQIAQQQGHKKNSILEL